MDLIEEIFEVPGFPGYGVTRSGKVFGRRKRKTGELSDKWNENRGTISRNEEKRMLVIDDSGKKKNVAVKFLIAKTFHGEFHDVGNCEIKYKDENKANLSSDNLIVVKKEEKKKKIIIERDDEKRTTLREDTEGLEQHVV